MENITDSDFIKPGDMLPPQKITEEPYWGEVMKVEKFDEGIDDEWLVSQIRELYEQ